MANEEHLQKIVEPLLLWFTENARELPWREDPRKTLQEMRSASAGCRERGADLSYKVWVSEIMLQQTRVEAVKPYFQRFLAALPGIRELAECPEEKLLKLWEGLGYYNRARNMQKAAVRILEEYGGALPADYGELRKLPGIGSYTAGAIASIAYGIPVPAVDGNVLRVISRIAENEEDIAKQSVKTAMEAVIGAIEPADCPGIFNQALMELGAVVCVPNGPPLCGRCPVARFCQAHLHGREQELPKKKAKQGRRMEERTVLVLRDGTYTVIRQRPKKGLLAGLYELPNLKGWLTEDEVLRYLRRERFAPLRIQPLEPAKHIFSHVEWRMTGYLVLVEDLAERRDRDGEFLVIEPERTEAEYPIPAAFTAYVKYLQIRLGQDKYRGESVSVER